MRFKNRNLRESILNNANNHFKTTYSKELRSNQLLTPKQIQERSLQAERKAAIAFDDEIENTNKHWLKAEKDYKAMFTLCKEEVKKEYQMYFEENEKNIGIQVKAFIHSSKEFEIHILNLKKKLKIFVFSLL